MIRLTDEEIIGAIDKANGGSEWREGWEIQDVLEEQDRSIAKVQLKKFRDIIKSDYPETLFLLEDLKFWHELLEEIK